MPADQVGRGIEKIKTIGTIRGWTLWKFQHLIEAGQLKVESAPSLDAALKMILNGCTDGVNLPLPIAIYHLKKINRLKKEYGFEF